MTGSTVSIRLVAPKSFPAQLKRICKIAAGISLEHLPKRCLRSYLQPKIHYELVISIVGPGVIRKLNLQYRKKNKATDVLSFPRLGSPLIPFAPPETLVGDVLICWQVAKRQAVEYRCSLKVELQRLTVHGVLHLFGYDHEVSKKEELRMFRLQESILRKLK